MAATEAGNQVEVRQMLKINASARPAISLFPGFFDTL